MLKSNLEDLLKAAVQYFQDKPWHSFYLSFCADNLKRLERDGKKAFFSPKQQAIFLKIESKFFPDGVKPVEKPVARAPVRLYPGFWDDPNPPF